MLSREEWEDWQNNEECLKDERTSNIIDCYFRIVHNNYDLCKQHEKEIKIGNKEYEKAGTELDDYDDEKFDSLMKHIDKVRQNECCKISVIVFSALLLEAIINDYGASNLSDAYYKKHIDKLNIKSKWVVVPRLATEKEFPTDTRAFELLGKLIKLRNMLVHHKTSKIPNTYEGFLKLSAKEDIKISDVDDAYECIGQCLTELNEIEEGDWQIHEYIAKYETKDM